MKRIFPYFLLVTLLFSATVAAAQDAPQLSSSLAKNLWRQCHFYFEEGMDAKATRACGELLAWAEENNEAAIVTETTGMVRALKEREQPAPAAPAPKPPKKSEVKADHPTCGYASIEAVPNHVMTKTVTNIPADFMPCASDADCVAATGFCGSKVATNKSSQTCYEFLAAAFSEQVGCQPMDPPPFRPVCREQRCTAQYGGY